jgi:protein-S-isoprenylcysteine O-methyltransferase Ste14
MVFILAGCLGFLLFFIYDVNSMKWQSNLVNQFFFIGFLLVLFSTTGAVYYVREDIVLNSVMSWLWISMILIFMILLIYSLFFALPFGSTYLENEKGRQVYTKGMYALSRHPGALWFIGLYFSIYFLTGNSLILIMAVVFSILNIVYVIFQDLWTFPRLFIDYKKYANSTPFIIPSFKSVNRMINTIRFQIGE